MNEHNTEINDLSAAMIPAMILGALGMMVNGAGLPAEIAELVPMLSSVAVPGVLAWVLSCLYAGGQQEEPAEEDALYE